MPTNLSNLTDEQLVSLLLAGGSSPQRAPAPTQGPAPRPTPATDWGQDAINTWRNRAPTPTRTTSTRPRSTSSTSSTSYDPLSSAYRPTTTQPVIQGPAPRPEPPRSTYSVDPLASAINRWQLFNGQYNVQQPSFDYQVEGRPSTATPSIQGTNYESQSLDPALRVPWMLPFPQQIGPVRQEDMTPTQQAQTQTSTWGLWSGSFAPTAPEPTPQETWANEVQRRYDSLHPSIHQRMDKYLVANTGEGSSLFPIANAFSPAVQYAEDKRNWRETHGASRRDTIDKPSWDRTRDMLMSGVHSSQIPLKQVQTTQVPYSRYLVDLVTGQPGADISLGQLAASAGEALNKVFNPLNPNNVIEGSADQNPFGEAWNIFTDALNKSRAARAQVEAMGPDANMALVNLINGGDRTVRAAQNIMTQDQQVADLYAQAEADSKAADALEAEGRFDEAAQLRMSSAQAGRAAYELKNKSKSDLVDETINPWAEIVGGFFLDPLNVIDIRVASEATKAARRAAEFSVSEAQAVKVLGGLTEEAPKILTWADWLYEPLDKGITYGDALIGDPKTWLQKVNPLNLLERTGETKARLASDTLYRAAVQLLTEVTDKETARQVLTLWANDPKQLVQGVQTAQGVYKVGGGVLANPYIVDYYPFLSQMADELTNLPALKGKGGFNPIEVLSSLEDAVYKGARKYMGLEALPDLPAGTIRTRIVKTGIGTSKLEYLSKKGKVIGSSAEMLPYDAQLLQKNIREAARTVGKGGAMGKAQAAWGLQKAILSDMYLGQSPGYWIKNSVSFTVHLLADDHYTLLPTRDIINDFARWYGVAPTTRTLDATMGATGAAASDAMGGGLHWLERIIGPNYYSSLMNKLYEIPFGATDIAGRIPFGEQNAALRGTYVPVKRYITNGWNNATRNLSQTLEAAGIDGDLARTIGAVARDAGVNGNKQRIAADVKDAVTAQTIRTTLSELGVPDELLSAQSWADLQDVFNSFLPDEIADAAAEVRRVFADELLKPGEILNAAPPTPSRTIYSTDEALRDGAELVDDTVEAARRAGDNIDEVRQTSQAIADEIARAETSLWAKLREDVANSDNPQALNVALDLLGKWYDWRVDARRRVDELSRAAIDNYTPEMWRQKWQGTQRIYGEFTQWFEDAVGQARHGILTGQAEGYDWFKAIQRYADYDEFAVGLERAAGDMLGKPGENNPLYSTVIGANREFLDSTYVELFSAFKRYASQDSLDLLASGIRKVEDMGAQTASYLAKQRELLRVGKLSKEAYYRIRNKAWAQFFDNAAIYNKVQQRLIVARGVAESVASNLQWTDDFAGGVFQLVGRLDDATWEARRVVDDTIHKFADPSALAQKRTSGVVTSSIPEVPKNIIDDFNRAIGNIETTVDEVLAGLERGLSEEEFNRYVDILAGLDTRPSTSALNEAEGLRAERVLAEQEAQTIGRGDIRAEWDRVAVAEFGLGDIDKTLRKYRKGDVIALPERFGEDLIGQTIAGQRIESTADVERLLQNYYDAGATRRARHQSLALQEPVAVSPSRDVLPTPASGAPRIEQQLTLTDIRRLANEAGIQTATDAGRPMDKRLVATINKDLKTNFKNLGEMTQDDLQRAAEALRKRAQPPDMRTYEYGIPSIDFDEFLTPLSARDYPYEIKNERGFLDYFGMGEGGNLYDLLKGLVSKSDSLMGEKAPEIGEMAAHTIRTLAQAEDAILGNLDALLAGKPNSLTPAQQLLVMDELGKLLPQWDNLLAGAAKVGEEAANFTMLNYGDRRNIDALLGFLSTYHFYYSRTPKNWMQRVVQKPSLLANYYRMERGIAAENEQNNVPEHFRGTIPNPFGIGPQRLGNPLTWMLPFAMVMGNEFVNSDEARSQTEKWYKNAQKYMPGFAPIIQFGAAAYLDQTAPLPDGQTRVGDIQLGDFAPLYRLGGYAQQAYTGLLGPQGVLAYGDQYDYGRAGKQVELQERRGNIREGGGAWGVDVGAQRLRGLEPLPEQPAGAEGWWQEGAQRAGLERLIGRGMSYLTGVPGYYLSPEEQQMRDMKANRVGLGYDPVENPYGSRAAVNEYTQQQGDAGFNYSKLYPGGENRERPGVAAATSDYWNLVNPEFDKMNQASAEFLTENPNASSKELREIKDPYYDNIKAIGEDFPSVTRKVGAGDQGGKPRNTKYMSPQERARYEVENMLGYEPPNKPEFPGEDADNKLLQQYYKDKATWDNKRLTQIDRNLNQLYSMETEAYPAPWMDIAKTLIGGEYASELMRLDSLRNVDPVEKDWSERQSFVEEVTDAEYRNRTKNVTDRLGAEGESFYSEYLSLPKGSEERAAFKDENPVVDVALFAAIHAKEYDTFVKQFGEDALVPVFLDKKPSHPGDNASDAAMQSYYKALDAYNTKYPEAEEVRLWVNGRRFGPDAPDDRYGKAWQEAKNIFGDDIFDVVNSFPSGGTKAQISAWYRQNGAKADLRSAYFAWKREHNEEDAKATGDWPEPFKPGNARAGEGYTGPRPVGTGFLPVGENRWWEPQQPNRWDTTDWGAVATSQSANPWTQRANELNAALLGDETIPSEMNVNVDTNGNLLPPAEYSPDSKTLQEYIKAGKSSGGGKSYRRRSSYTPYRRSSGRRRSGGGGGGGAGGSYYVPRVDPREFPSWLTADPRIPRYEAPRNVAPRTPDIGPSAIKAWRPISWK